MLNLVGLEPRADFRLMRGPFGALMRLRPQPHPLRALAAHPIVAAGLTGAVGVRTCDSLSAPPPRRGRLA
eukprot:5351308-Alexandrium_andersonii.AAC.1